MERRRPSSSTSQRLRQMVDIARCLIEGRLEDRLSAVVEHAPRALGLRSASIFLVREDFAGFGERLALPGVELIQGSPRPEGLTAQVLHTGKPLVVEDSHTFSGVNPRVLEAGIGSFLAVPLNSSAGCLGVLYLNQFAPQTFSQADIELAEAIGDMVGQAVENARLQEREQAMRQALEMEREHLASLTATLNSSLSEAELLRDAGQEAGAAADLHQLLARMLDQVKAHVPADGAAILLCEQDGLVVAAIAGVTERTTRQTLRRGEQPVWHVVETGEALLDRPRGRARPAAMAPLRWRGEVFGILELTSARQQAFDVPHLNLLRKVADQIAGWIYLAHR